MEAIAARFGVTSSTAPQREVHAVALGEVRGNGSGGVTCLTRPLLRGR